MFQLINRPFPTRKRSSENLIWVAWASILLAALAVAGVFNVTQISLVERHDVRFVNLRMPVLEDFRDTAELGPRDSELSGDSPLLFVGKNNVIVGSVQSVTSPDRGGDVVLLEKNNWRAGIFDKIANWPKAKKLLPARAIALAFESDSDASEVLASIQFVKRMFSELNEKIGGEDLGFEPMVTIINMGQLKVASTRSNGNP